MKAKSKVMTNTAEKILDVLDQADAIAAEDFLKILDRALIEKSERLPVSDETILAVVKLSPKVSETEKKAILATLPAMKNCREQVLAFTIDGARAAWLASLDEVAKKLASGATLAQSEGWNRADFERDFAAKQESAKFAGDRACEKFMAAIKKPVARFILHCDALAASIENAEKQSFAEFSVAYERSPLVKSIAAVGNLARIRNPGRPQWGTRTDEILVFLNLGE